MSSIFALPPSLTRGTPSITHASLCCQTGEMLLQYGVEVKVVFQKVGDENQAAGLWFNSPKLRR